MLIHPWDAASDDEWRTMVARVSFGQLIASAPGDRYPTVVPTHYVYDGGGAVRLHLARPNPVWRAVEADPHVVLAVVADYVYVEAAWNAALGSDPDYGVPTSYYAAVQLRCTAEIIDDPERKLEVLREQLAQFEPPGSGRVPPTSQSSSDHRLLPGIRGLSLTVESVEAKMKYGGNKSVDHRRRIADRLAGRGGPQDAAARDHLLRRADGGGPGVPG
jgi:transcriptional regulator